MQVKMSLLQRIPQVKGRAYRWWKLNSLLNCNPTNKSPEKKLLKICPSGKALAAEFNSLFVKVVNDTSSEPTGFPIDLKNDSSIFLDPISEAEVLTVFSGLNQ